MRSRGRARASGAPWLGAVVLAAALATSGPARAFGGLWSSRPGAPEHARVQVLLADHAGPTVTAVVRLTFAAPARDFVWLVPVAGTPTVELSSATVFDRLEQATAPAYWREVAYDGSCMEEEPAPAADAAPDANTGGAEAVRVLAAGGVGPYEHLTLELDAALDDPAGAAVQWLADHGYSVGDTDAEALRPYLDRGFSLLALRLAPGTSARTARPVALTYDSPHPTIPLRAASLTAGDDVALQVWVVGPSQAVPTNYASVVLNDARVDWLSAQPFPAGTLPEGGAGPFGIDVPAPANYDAVVTAAVDEADGHGFVTELAAPASQYRDKVWSDLDAESFASLQRRAGDDGIDVVLAAQNYFAGWDGLSEAVAGATTLSDGVELAAFLADPEAHRDAASVDTDRLLELVEAQVVKPVADAGALLHAGPYLTRLYTRLGADEMTADPAFDYNPDLAQLDGVHIARQRIECSPSLRADEAPWRVELPQGGVVVGDAGDWPLGNAVPASLKLVTLSTAGPGMVVEDHAEQIRRALREAGGDVLDEPPVPQGAQHGVPIGGGQTLVRPQHVETTDAELLYDGRHCALVGVGDAAPGAAAWTLPLATLCIALRRSRRQRRRRAS